MKNSKRREIQGRHMKDTKNERERYKRKYRGKFRKIQEKNSKKFRKSKISREAGSVVATNGSKGSCLWLQRKRKGKKAI